MSTVLTPGSEPTMKEALDLIAQRCEWLAQMNEALRLLTEGGAMGATARGAADRITIADLVAKANAAMTTNTRRTYLGYMQLLADGDPSRPGPDGRPGAGIGHMGADEVLPSHLERALQVVDQRAARRAKARAEQRAAAERSVRRTNGDGARYNAIGAWRRLFEVGIRDRHLAAGMNPASKLKKPKRKKGGARMALEDKLYQDMFALLSSTGDDPELDELILRFLDITGARQEGVLNLRLQDIDRSECTVLLREKFETDVDQPVPDWFIEELLEFAHRRGAVNRGDGLPQAGRAGALQADREASLQLRLLRQLQSSFTWADDMQVTAHTLRHHATTKVQRHAGSAVSPAFARPALVVTNDIYTEASQREVAQAVIDLHGGDHPWLHRQPRPRR